MQVLNILTELQTRYEDQFGYLHPRVPGLTEADVQRWSVLLDEPRSMLYDQIAMHLAYGFHVSEMTFAFCDAVVNDLHGVIVSADEHRPKLFWAVYLAFDEGEYYHENNRNEDPVELYTRPMIARILRAGSATR
jgi:hypothetical protein